MNKENYIALLDYDLWANDKIAQSLIKYEHVPAKCKILFHHIAAANDVWLSRIVGSERLYNNLFEESDPNENIKILEDLKNKWISFIKKEDNFDRIIEYKNTKGVEFQNTVNDILNHLLAHGNYHRGQINQLLSQTGLQPPSIDYIVYKR